MTGLHLLSTAVLVVLLIGFSQRAHARRHRAFMLVAFAADLGLVLWIEATRHAVEKVAGGVPPLVQLHVAISTGVLVCYVAMIALGTRLFVGRVELRSMHRHVGTAFVALRGLNYVTSFFV